MFHSTFHGIYAAGLLALGAKELITESTQYRVFLIPPQLDINGEVYEFEHRHIYLDKTGKLSWEHEEPDNTLFKAIQRAGTLSCGITPDVIYETARSVYDRFDTIIDL